ncbi:hypothetical protein PILCRDRAFT_90272 [Piloderma croceum F 1598]|uniref:Uncharacterized protein n=1 Tax=Piloderma croceum (strain F 1598) TaxID=765440 RepID=A0A0C3FH74_PILCF|nr:hypothetical protein PILCRDRAFT_90272 [Piloderma croceum F 1598]
MAFHVVAAGLRPMDEVKSKRHYKQTLEVNENCRARRNVSFFHKNEIWKQELQMAVETGVVFQPNGRGRDPWIKAGRYRLVKSKWHWVKLTAEEWKAIGRPPRRPGLFF